MEYLKNRTWVEIDLDNIIHNFREFVRISNKSFNVPKVRVMGVIKANGYGHGSVTIAKALVVDGIDYLAVASLDEGIELRNAGITTPILILNYISPQRACDVIKYNFSQTVYSFELAEAISRVALTQGTTAKLHIKLDTGMTRVGLNIEDAFETIKKISQLQKIEIEGIFTHFAKADETDPEYTKLQFERFMDIVHELENDNIQIPLKHVCNSAGSINFPFMHLDMIRPGISLYGLYPSDEVERSLIDLKPVMTFKSQIIRVNEVEEGVRISYGGIFTTTRKSRIATIPAGYADGFTRTLTGKAKVLVNGQLAPIVGKICMDQCMIDVTDVLGDVLVGDEVVLFGEQKGARILVDDVASLIGTINYEIVCMVNRRVPRFFLKEGQIVGVENYLV